MDSRILVAMPYATPANFTGVILYRSGEAWLRRGTAERLREAQDRLNVRGVRLKVLDAYRPPAAQRALWAAFPNPRFVAPPERGSRHTRGTAVDVTLATKSGIDLDMPSAFDDFGECASRKWPEMNAAARRHLHWLTDAMVAAGFSTIESEWWHYDDMDWAAYPLLDLDFEDLEDLEDPEGSVDPNGVGSARAAGGAL